MGLLAQRSKVENVPHELQVVLNAVDYLHAKVPLLDLELVRANLKRKKKSCLIFRGRQIIRQKKQVLIVFTLETSQLSASTIEYSVSLLLMANMRSVKFCKAGPPFWQLNLMPKSLSGPPGLWLAVRMMPKIQVDSDLFWKCFSSDSDRRYKRHSLSNK